MARGGDRRPAAECLLHAPCHGKSNDEFSVRLWVRLGLFQSVILAFFLWQSGFQQPEGRAQVLSSDALGAPHLEALSPQILRAL